MTDGGEDFNLGHVVGAKGDKGDKGDKGNTGDTGNGISSIVLQSTSGKVKTYRITFTNGNHFDFQVTDGNDGTSPIVTNWEQTLSDEKVPSEKLTKNSLDGKSDTGHTHTKSNITDFPTIPSKTSDLNNDSGFITSSSLPTKTSDLQNDGDGTNAFLTQHQSLTNYIQKSNTVGLIKNNGTIDTNTYLTTSSASSTYVAKESGKGLSSNDFTNSYKNTMDNLKTVATSGSYNDLSNKPSIPSSSSDLSDGSDLVKKSSTTGLLKNDGNVDTNSYLTTSSASSTYQTKLISGTSIKTINNESLLGSGNISVGGGSSVDIVTAWESTPSDSKVASEKLVKDSLDDIEDLIGDAITYINQ